MRFWLLMLAVLVLAGAGCAHPKGKVDQEYAVPKSYSSPVEKAGPDSAPAKPSKAVKRPERVTPVTSLTGHVALVNDRLRYVIVEFPVGQMAAKDQRLSVFRDGSKVGEIQISAQSRDFNYAADITAGEARVGDEVRER